jgi:uncharacterized protein YggU (UPF0235/DUF167 family)
MKTIEVTVQTKASSRGVEELGGGKYKVRTTVAPDGGKANEDVVRQLAKHLGVAKSLITLVSGPISRRKILRIEE